MPACAITGPPILFHHLSNRSFCDRSKALANTATHPRVGCSRALRDQRPRRACATAGDGASSNGHAAGRSNNAPHRQPSSSLRIWRAPTPWSRQLSATASASPRWSSDTSAEAFQDGTRKAHRQATSRATWTIQPGISRIFGYQCVSRRHELGLAIPRDDSSRRKGPWHRDRAEGSHRRPEGSQRRVMPERSGRNRHS